MFIYFSFPRILSRLTFLLLTLAFATLPRKNLQQKNSLNPHCQHHLHHPSGGIDWKHCLPKISKFAAICHSEPGEKANSRVGNLFLVNGQWTFSLWVVYFLSFRGSGSSINIQGMKNKSKLSARNEMVFNQK